MPVAARQPTGKSKTQQLREVKPDRGIISYLDKMRIGFISKRKTRVVVARKYTALEKRRGTGKTYESPLKRKDGRSLYLDVEPTPYPFKQYGSLIEVVKDKDSLPLSWKGERPEDNHVNKKAIDSYFQKHVKTFQPADIAIIGRSNVGKSTLVNHLLRFDSSFVQKSSISDKPGETKQLHFYALGKYTPPTKAPVDEADKIVLASAKKFLPPALIIVDMPGYGFAYMGDEDKRRCQELMQTYLFERQNLKRLLLLLDARHGLKMSDMQFFATLGEKLRETKRHVNWKLQIVMTKCDLVDRLELARRMQIVKDVMYQKIPGSLIEGSLPVMAISCWEKKGLFELKKELAALGPNTTKPRTRKDNAEIEEKLVGAKKVPILNAVVEKGECIAVQKKIVYSRNDAIKVKAIAKSFSNSESSDIVKKSGDLKSDDIKLERKNFVFPEISEPKILAREKDFVISRKKTSFAEAGDTATTAEQNKSHPHLDRYSLLNAFSTSKLADMKAVADKRLRAALKRHVKKPPILVEAQTSESRIEKAVDTASRNASVVV